MCMYIAEYVRTFDIACTCTCVRVRYMYYVQLVCIDEDIVGRLHVCICLW